MGDCPWAEVFLSFCYSFESPAVGQRLFRFQVGLMFGHLSSIGIYTEMRFTWFLVLKLLALLEDVHKGVIRVWEPTHVVCSQNHFMTS